MNPLRRRRRKIHRKRRTRSGYLIEFRFFGKAKHEARRLIYEVDRKFRLRRTKKIRPVPHITIVAPFTTKNQGRLVGNFKKICSKYSVIKFKVNGYGCFDAARVVYINIDPSENLMNFRMDLLRKMSDYCRLCQTDFFKLLGIFPIYKRYHAHATIAMKLPQNKYESVKRYVYNKKEPSFNHILIRATLMKDRKILYEYDFIQKRMLTRRQAKNKQILSKTMSKLRNGDF